MTAPVKLRASPMTTLVVSCASLKKIKPAQVRNTSFKMPVTFKASGPPMATVIAMEKENADITQLFKKIKI